MASSFQILVVVVGNASSFCRDKTSGIRTRDGLLDVFPESCWQFGGELGRWNSPFNQLPGSVPGPRTEVEDTFVRETDRIPGFRELSGY